ncbi:hypothetical protein Hdeb2414_s0014g00431521 [Helianthus debilis subsp. tardiflorus]
MACKCFLMFSVISDHSEREISDFRSFRPSPACKFRGVETNGHSIFHTFSPQIRNPTLSFTHRSQLITVSRGVTELFLCWRLRVATRRSLAIMFRKHNRSQVNETNGCQIRKKRNRGSESKKTCNHGWRTSSMC